MYIAYIAFGVAAITFPAAALAQEANPPPAPPPGPSQHAMTPADKTQILLEAHAMSQLIKYRRGEISLTAAEVKQYTDILNARKARTAYQKAPGDAVGPQAPHLTVRETRLEAFAVIYSRIVGKTVIVADRAKKAGVSMTVAAKSDAEIVPLIDAQLHAEGIAVISDGQTVTLDFAFAPPLRP